MHHGHLRRDRATSPSASSAPALYNCLLGGFLPPEFTVVGFARRELTRRGSSATTCSRGSTSTAATGRRSRRSGSRSHAASSTTTATFDDPAAYAELAKRLDRIDRDRGTAGNRLFYLAVPPALYPEIVNQLERAGLAARGERRRSGSKRGWTRVIVEKPFGSDLEPARSQLNREHRRRSSTRTRSIGSITTSARRRSRTSPSSASATACSSRSGTAATSTRSRSPWPRRSGVEGRGEFYDADRRPARHRPEPRPPAAGHVRHGAAGRVRAPRTCATRSSRCCAPSSRCRRRTWPTNTVRGQYVSGWVEGEKVTRYRDEPEVAPDSETETFVALKLAIDSWRWAGVPVLHAHRQGAAEPGDRDRGPVPHARRWRSSRAPACRRSSRTCSPSGSSPTRASSCASAPRCRARASRSAPSTWTSGTDRRFAVDSPDAYETLLLDAMIGDASLFTRDDEVERAWEILDPILATWAAGRGRAAPLLRGRHLGSAGGRRAARARRPSVAPAVSRP